MNGMPMPGSGAMSMVWTRLPGQTWLGAATSFLAMWVVMMAAMMLPSLLPALSSYRQAITGAARRGWLTALVGIAYFLVWTAFGLIVFPIGAALAVIELQERALARIVPYAAGAVIVLAGVLQLSAWRARHLACCRGDRSHGDALPATSATAWRHGVRLGLHCCCSCAGAVTVLLVLGVMDPGVMAVVTAAITAERLAPAGARVARFVGGMAIAAGMFLMVRVAMPG
jgi:predicted metal-binding membrane protein